MFDPFYTTKPGGTGLGLAIVQKIIDSLGGRIEVVSREGDGVTFTVYLKQAPDEARSG
ncbi:MAG: ATP-binding protein [candidate division NC10 bacterium]